jgi:Anti-CBASS Acb1-like protein
MPDPTSSQLTISNSATGNSLQTLLISDDIVPGSAPSYQLCKTILSYHPLGPRLTEGPIKLSQSQSRILSLPTAGDAEDRVLAQFEKTRLQLGVDRHLRNWAKLSRAYGVSALSLVTEDPKDNQQPIDFPNLHHQKIAFSVFDPLNVAGSLVLNQIPTDASFLKPQGISVMGINYHRSRSVVLMNEEPIYIEWTTSAFGYVGRSVFQRPLYPLKSYIQTMIADDMVSMKAGVLIIKTRQPGNIINQVMQSVSSALKRSLVQQSATNNVINIAAGDPQEEVSSINLENVNKAMETSRSNILENIATSADMPAILVKQESYSHGFSEGSEDAKKVAEFVSDIRNWMEPGYEFTDEVAMYVGWSPPFYETIQKEFPELYQSVPFEEAFYSWKNNLVRTWPSLIEEPESDRVRVDEVKLKSAILIGELLLPELDPEHKAILVGWLADCFNERKLLFPAPLDIDEKKLARFFKAALALQQQNSTDNSSTDNKPSGRKSKDQRSKTKVAMDNLGEAASRLPDLSVERMKRKALARSSED